MTRLKSQRVILLGKLKLLTVLELRQYSWCLSPLQRQFVFRLSIDIWCAKIVLFKCLQVRSHKKKSGDANQKKTEVK